MKKTLTAVAAFGLAIGLSSVADAADPAKKKKAEPVAITDKMVDEMFAKLDANNDKKIDAKEFAEFKGFAAKTPKKDKLAGVRDAWFKKLDANGDGALDATEFQKIKDGPPAKKKKAKKAT